jgi:anti-sigma B factor antagonist
MKIDQRTDGSVLVIQPVTKSLDASSVQDFRDAINPLLRQHDKILVDLGNITFVDSAGVGALISCLRVVSELKGRFAICGLTRAVSALFDLMRMHRVFEVHVDSASALRSLA